MTQAETLPPRLAYSDRELTQYGLMTRKTRWRRRKEGTFPEPIVSGSRILYRAVDIHEWLEDPAAWAERRAGK